MELKIRCKPCWDEAGRTVGYMDIRVSVKTAPDEQPAADKIASPPKDDGREKEDVILAEIVEQIVGVPGCRTEGMRFSGPRGEIPYREARQESSPHIHTIRYLAESEEVGEYEYEYRAFPRQVGPEGHSAPLFDLRREEGGINGAGVAFLALPAFETARVSVTWDMSEMPRGAEAVCAFFEGDGTLSASRDQLLYSYYGCGLLNKEAGGDFGMYWFGHPPFDAADAADRLRRLFEYMKDFFGEREEKPYRIFVRKDPFDDSGHGTAGQRSFLFGYSDKMAPSVDDLMDLLAHEMVHNWPAMEDEPAGLGTWYVEGCAEYYSIVLPLRAGITDPAHTEKALRRRCAPYFGNPWRYTPNLEAGKAYWKDSAAQRMPYGRGFFYLARTDMHIRRASCSQRSLDDIVLALCHIPGGRPTELCYRELLKKELGEDGLREYEAMCQGALMLPEEGMFDGAFWLRAEDGPDDTGEGSCTRYEFVLRRDNTDGAE